MSKVFVVYLSEMVGIPVRLRAVSGLEVQFELHWEKNQTDAPFRAIPVSEVFVIDQGLLLN